MVKPLVALASLALGTGAAAVLVLLQTHPLLLTNPSSHSVVPLQAALLVRPLAPPVTVTEDATSPVVAVREVTVYGATAHRSAPARHAPATTVKAAAPAPEPAVKVIPAPCVDGQYRQLDEHRGVRLRCFPRS